MHNFIHSAKGHPSPLLHWLSLQTQTSTKISLTCLHSKLNIGLISSSISLKQIVWYSEDNRDHLSHHGLDVHLSEFFVVVKT